MIELGVWEPGGPRLQTLGPAGPDPCSGQLATCWHLFVPQSPYLQTGPRIWGLMWLGEQR